MVTACPPRVRANGPTPIASEPFTRMQCAVTTLLRCIGEDPEREGLVDTPKRVAKAWLDMTHGSCQDPSKAFGSALFHEPVLTRTGDGVVLVRDISFAALSSETLLPFHGAVHVAYLPSAGAILGLSKLARVTRVLAARLQSQRQLTSAVLEQVQAHLAPLGATVVCVARHLGVTGRDGRPSPPVVCWEASGKLLDLERQDELEALLGFEPGMLGGSGDGAVALHGVNAPGGLGALHDVGNALDAELPAETKRRHQGQATLAAAVATLGEAAAQLSAGSSPTAPACAAYADWLLSATAGYLAAETGPADWVGGSAGLPRLRGQASPSSASSTSDMDLGEGLEMDDPAGLGRSLMPALGAVSRRRESARSDSSASSCCEFSVAGGTMRPVQAWTLPGEVDPETGLSAEDDVCRPVGPGELLASCGCAPGAGWQRLRAGVPPGCETCGIAASGGAAAPTAGPTPPASSAQPQTSQAPRASAGALLRVPTPVSTAATGALHVAVIQFDSMCEHHMLPFHGSVAVAVAGAAGTPCPPPTQRFLTALVARFSRRLQVQERLTAQLADAAWAAAAPNGAAAVLVVLRSAHMCMVARGVEQHASTTMTVGDRGSWKEAGPRRGDALRLLMRLAEE